MQVSSSAHDQAIEVSAFLGLTEQQSKLLVALYNETDPEFAKQLPTAMPIAAEQLDREYEKRNRVGNKLTRAEKRWQDEFSLFDEIQQETVDRLRQYDMNIDRAVADLAVDEAEDGSVHDLVMASLLLGGLRSEPAEEVDQSYMSPVASPHFDKAKRLLERAFDKDYTMAAVQIGSCYMQEHKLAQGKHIPGQDPQALAYAWYAKAANKGNPVACHKLGYFLEKGIGCNQNLAEAIRYYTRAFEQCYPDSAHNLGLLYQGNSETTVDQRDIPASLRYFQQANEWEYAPSANAIGRMYLLMSKDNTMAQLADKASCDREELITTGIEYMEHSANNGDADAMLMLGLLHGSNDYGIYDMDKAQNYMELALIRRNPEAYEYLVRALRVKMATRIALEDQNLETFEKLSPAEQELLVRQLAQQSETENSFRRCANPSCDRKEEQSGEFKQCGQCQKAFYCSKDCQKEHWKGGHKTLCATATLPSSVAGPQ